MVSRRGTGATPVNFASIGSNQILGGSPGPFGRQSATNLQSSGGAGGRPDFVQSHQAQQDAIFFAKYGYNRQSDTLGFPSGPPPEPSGARGAPIDEDPYGPIVRKGQGAGQNRVGGKSQQATSNRKSIRDTQPFAHHHAAPQSNQNLVVARKQPAKQPEQDLMEPPREVDLTFAPLSAEEKRRVGGRTGGIPKRKSAVTTTKPQPIAQASSISAKKPVPRATSNLNRNLASKTSQRHFGGRPESTNSQYDPTEMCKPERRQQSRGTLKATQSNRGAGQPFDMGSIPQPTQATAARSRLPPTHSKAAATGIKRGIAGLNTKPKMSGMTSDNIRVPKKSYNLNNLGPDAYPDEAQASNTYVTHGGGGADGLEQCYNCGRSFNAEALARHENICKKVFSQKRKVFNTAKQRVVDRQQMVMAKRGAAVDKKIERAKAAAPVSKWQAQSNQLRQMMQAARQPVTFGQPRGRGGPGGARGGAAQAQQMPAYEQHDDRVPCRYCGRKFNEEAAERHIPYCQNKAKQASLRPKPVGRGRRF